MIEMDKTLSMNTNWTCGSIYIQSSLSDFSVNNKDNHNIVFIKKEADLQGEKRSSQVFQNMKHSQISINKEKDKVHYELASPSDTVTTNYISQSFNSVSIKTITNYHENTHINSEIRSIRETCRRGQIDVIEMPIEQANFFKYFLVYEDLPSKFVVLHALHSNTAKEVANKLLDILAIIGVPKILQSGNGRNFAEEIVRELRTLWEDFIILHGNVCKCEEDNRDFKNLLKCWLNKNPGKTWYEGLKYIQIFQNSTYRCGNGKIPCDILFGQNINQEFQKLLITKNSTSEMWTEEEWISDMLNKKKSNSSTDNNVFHASESTIPVNTNDTDKENDNCRIEGDDMLYNNYKTNEDESLQSYKSSNNFKFVNVKSEAFLDNQQIEDSICAETNDTEECKPHKNNQDLICKICHKQYIKLGHLKNHMKTHIKKKQFNCTVCNKTFRILKLYEKHMQQFHDNFQQVNNHTNHTNTNKNYRKCTNINIGKKEGTETKELLKINISTIKSRKNNKILLNHTNKYIRSINKSTLLNDEQFPRKKEENRISRLNGNPLECSYCKQKFNFPSVLKRHMRSHTNERPYVCKVCNKSFKQLGHLSQHSLTHKDYRSFQCAICSVKFESLDLLKTHSQSHQGEPVLRSKEIYRLFECDNCKKVFTTKSVLERHLFTHTHERQFACKICGKRFKQAGHVKSHMLVHTGERKFECSVCSKRFSLSNSLKKHMYIHNGEKPYQCDVCGARFLEKRNLNGHLMTHTNERPFSCKICGKRYTLADTLRRHISAAHEDGRTYQCEICAKMFKQLAHLSVHKKVHNDERPFQCHLCEKNFKHKNVLKSHLAIHANIRPFECDICKATFVRKTNLQTHIASAHMNERPYICTICGKRFKQISHLNGHVVVHSNSMPYQCDFCDRRCNRLDNLKKHMRLHTKDKEEIDKR